MMQMCRIDGCEGQVRRRPGFCLSHFDMWKRTGSTDLPPRPTLADRFWVKVEKTDGCWLWRGALSATSGGRYGQIQGDDRRMVKAHRVSYELCVGPIPDGLVIDHLCRNTRCVNPAHLEPVPNRVNVLRGVAPKVAIHHSGSCSKGHAIEGENIAIDQAGRPQCRTCRNAHARASHHRNSHKRKLKHWTALKPVPGFTRLPDAADGRRMLRCDACGLEIHSHGIGLHVKGGMHSKAVA